MSQSTASLAPSLLEELCSGAPDSRRHGRSRGAIITYLAHAEHQRSGDTWPPAVAAFTAAYFHSRHYRVLESHAQCREFTDLLTSGAETNTFLATLRDANADNLTAPSLSQSHLLLSPVRSRCSRQWFEGDLAYHCVECAVDPQCAICLECFNENNHRDHTVTLVNASAGFCDCGDRLAWKAEGACFRHRHRATTANGHSNDNEVVKQSLAANGSDVTSSDDDDATETNTATNTTTVATVDSDGNESNWSQFLDSASDWSPSLPFDGRGTLLDPTFPCRIYCYYTGIVQACCTTIQSLGPRPTKYRKFASQAKILSWLRKMSRGAVLSAALAFALCQPMMSSREQFHHWLSRQCPIDSDDDTGSDSQQPSCLEYLFSLCALPGPIRSPSRMDRAMLELVSSLLSHTWNDYDWKPITATAVFLRPSTLSFKRFLVRAFLRHYASLVYCQSSLTVLSAQLFKSSAFSTQLLAEHALDACLLSLKTALDESSRERADRSLYIDVAHPAVLAQRHYSAKVDCIYLLRQRSVSEALTQRLELLAMLASLTSRLDGLNPLSRIVTGPHVRFESDDWQFAFELEHDVQQINGLILQTRHPSAKQRWRWRWLAIIAKLLEQHFHRTSIADPSQSLDDSVTKCPVSFHWPLHRCFLRLWLQVFLSSSESERRVLDSLLSMTLTVPLSRFWLSLSIAPLRLNGGVGSMRAGLWTRNGECVQGSQSCYRSPSFATHGATADIATIQASIIASETNHRRVLSIADACLAAFGFSDETFVGSLEDSQWLTLCAECLRFMVALVIDRSAWSPDTACIRSELVHALASHSNPSHSNLLASLSEPHTRSVHASVFDAALTDLADFTPARVNQPGHYTIKSGSWSEFNPFHHRFLPHETANSEQRYRTVETLGPVSRATAAQHCPSLDWLLCLLHCQSLHAVIVSALSAALESQGDASLTDEAELRMTNPRGHSHERSVRAVVTLIALMAVTMPNGDSETDDGHTDPHCTRCPLVPLRVSASWLDASVACAALPIDVELQLRDPSVTTQAAAASIPACLARETAAFVAMASRAMATLRSVDFAPDLRRLVSLLVSRGSVHTANDCEDARESARVAAKHQTKARQERILRAFERRQRQFMDLEAPLPNTANAAAALSKSADTAPVLSEVSAACCLCRESSEGARTLGVVCLVNKSGLRKIARDRAIERLQQLTANAATGTSTNSRTSTSVSDSAAVGGTATRGRKRRNSQSLVNDGDSPRFDSDYVLTSCHHRVHLDCHASFLASRVSTDGLHFSCPACRRPANSVLPLFETDSQRAALLPSWRAWIESASALLQHSDRDARGFVMKVLDGTLFALELAQRERLTPITSSETVSGGNAIEALHSEVSQWRRHARDSRFTPILASLLACHRALSDQSPVTAATDRDALSALLSDKSVATMDLNPVLTRAAVMLSADEFEYAREQIRQLRMLQVADTLAALVNIQPQVHSITIIHPCCIAALVAYISVMLSRNHDRAWVAGWTTVCASATVSEIASAFLAPITNRAQMLAEARGDTSSQLPQSLLPHGSSCSEIVHVLQPHVPFPVFAAFTMARTDCSFDLGFPLSLAPLPVSYSGLLTAAPNKCCASCWSPLTALGALCCMLCGMWICPNLRHRCVVKHCRQCEGQLCAVLAVKRTDTIIGDCDSSAYTHWPSCYLDQWQETDINLVRGRALTLSTARLAALTQSIATHTLPAYIKQHGHTQRAMQAGTVHTTIGHAPMTAAAVLATRASR